MNDREELLDLEHEACEICEAARDAVLSKHLLRELWNVLDGGDWTDEFYAHGEILIPGDLVRRIQEVLAKE